MTRRDRIDNQPIPTESRHLRHARQRQLATDLDKRQARIALETGQPLPPPSSSSRKTPAGGDARQLRGIPALARGVSGAINGTRPDAR
jgi:hypothetical protein